MSGRGFVYVISGKYQKIGHSRSPGNRLDHFKTASPYKLTLAFTLECWNAERAERMAHGILAAKRLNGEWFDIPQEEAIRIVKECVTAVENDKPGVAREIEAATGALDPTEDALRETKRVIGVAHSFLRLLQRVQWEIAQHHDETREIVLHPETEGEIIDTLVANGLRRWQSGLNRPHVPFDDGWAPIRVDEGML